MFSYHNWGRGCCSYLVGRHQGCCSPAQAASPQGIYSIQNVKCQGGETPLQTSDSQRFTGELIKNADSWDPPCKAHSLSSFHRAPGDCDDCCLWPTPRETLLGRQDNNEGGVDGLVMRHSPYVSGSARGSCARKKKADIC